MVNAAATEARRAEDRPRVVLEQVLDLGVANEAQVLRLGVRSVPAISMARALTAGGGKRCSDAGAGLP